MKFGDKLRMCLQNLFRRKSRTFLTVLGVIVGCCSVVVMISIGIGLKQTQEEALSEMGDLTIITVMQGSSGSKATKLDDSLVKQIEEMSGVVAVTPTLTADNLSFTIYAGDNRRYVCQYSTVVGMNLSALTDMGYEVTDGEFPKTGTDDVLVGQYTAYDFMDSMRPDGYNMVDRYSMYQDDGTVTDPPDPYFDILKAPLTMEITIGDTGKTITQDLKPVGKTKEDYGKGYETSEGIIMDISTLKQLLQQANEASGTASSTTSNTYENILVKVADIKQISQIEEDIQALGVSTSSMESIRKPMEEQAQKIQMILGGIGAVALLVAAIGITNTMIMSISERTREIGVMKALGCYLRDIRGIFLMEAGGIGFLGGCLGLVFSYAISFIINYLSAQGTGDLSSLASSSGSGISIIPPWLALFAVAFSVLIGVAAGYYPANKAMRISVLEAIRHE